MSQYKNHLGQEDLLLDMLLCVSWDLACHIPKFSPPVFVSTICPSLLHCSNGLFLQAVYPSVTF